MTKQKRMKELKPVKRKLGINEIEVSKQKFKQCKIDCRLMVNRVLLVQMCCNPEGIQDEDQPSFEETGTQAELKGNDASVLTSENGSVTSVKEELSCTIYNIIYHTHKKMTQT